MPEPAAELPSPSNPHLLIGAETSGGLLLSVPGSQADELLALLGNSGISHAARIGEIVDDSIGITVED